MKSLFRGIAALLVVYAALVSAASAETLPAYDGAPSFSPIESASDPEEYSWEVSLSDGQALRLLDEKNAEVYDVGSDQTTFTITAPFARDANAIDVPTSLAVSGGNVVTLVVHHRAGNPSDEGAPFAYPVTQGRAWIVIGGGSIESAPLEDSVEEIINSIVLASPAALAGTRPTGARRCRVPNLTGRSLAASRQRLGNTHCTFGRVSRRKGATNQAGKVVRQVPRAGVVTAPGASVDVVLAAPAAHSS